MSRPSNDVSFRSVHILFVVKSVFDIAQIICVHIVFILYYGPMTDKIVRTDSACVTNGKVLQSWIKLIIGEERAKRNLL